MTEELEELGIRAVGGIDTRASPTSIK